MCEAQTVGTGAGRLGLTAASGIRRGRGACNAQGDARRTKSPADNLVSHPAAEGVLLILEGEPVPRRYLRLKNKEHIKVLQSVKRASLEGPTSCPTSSVLVTETVGQRIGGLVPILRGWDKVGQNLGQRWFGHFL
ncbi:MAG: hypothetical protein JWO71_1312 [Candidatus Acidoferrum typicum]|nr:hypothetical protein [Candidatus Acidoferrum typicum]